MAHRRMFSRDITDSDEFLDMPQSTQAFYFHLGMAADDDGFVGSARSIARKCNAGQDDFKLLLAKQFILGYPSGLIVIKAWRFNNQIRGDRYTETKYLKEKKQLFIRENGMYTFQPENALAIPKGAFNLKELFSGNHLATKRQPSIGKVSKVKDSREVKPKAPHASISYLRSIPEKDMKQFTDRFAVGEKKVREKAEQFLLYCESTGKKYKNYKSALLNAMIKDFEQRTEEEQRKPIMRPKLDESGSPVIRNGAVVMETV